MPEPLFRKIDNLLLKVDDLNAALAFYRDGLGHRLIWRDEEAAGLALPETDAELVLHRRVGPESDLLVDDVETAFQRFIEAGGEAVEAPFDIAIGRCACVRDPFGNELVMLDQSKGPLTVDADGYTTGVEARTADHGPTPAAAEKT
ncbi:MAG TPA: VOC family protein [Kaistia sp.]|nr:VOC family protein [Kaistia sp.]